MNSSGAGLVVHLCRTLEYGVRGHDAVLLDVSDDELEHGRGDEVSSAANTEQRSRVREGHRVELSHHGK